MYINITFERTIIHFYIFSKFCQLFQNITNTLRNLKFKIYVFMVKYHFSNVQTQSQS